MPTPPFSTYRELTFARVAPDRVESLWSFSAEAMGPHRVLPDGRMDVLVRFRVDQRQHITDRRLIITGPATRYVDIPVAQDDRFLGLRFQPGWGGACLGVNPASLRDEVLLDDAACAVLGQHEVYEVLHATTISTLQSLLLELARQRSLRASALADGAAAAVALMHASAGRLSLRELSVASGMGERSVRRHIMERVGLTFSAFSAVLRFQRAMRLLAIDKPMTLAHVATECGYSDQAHMTREFRRHGGFTPGHLPPVTLVGMPLQGVAAIFNPA